MPILSALAEGGVDFVVVGGVAGGAHGSSYPTYDLDVAYGRDETNLHRLAAVLMSLGARLRGRGRETDGDILRRLDRAASVEVDGPDVIRLDNSGALETAGEALLRLLVRPGA